MTKTFYEELKDAYPLQIIKPTLTIPYVSISIMIVYIALLVVYYTTPETLNDEEKSFYISEFDSIPPDIYYRDTVLYIRLLMNNNGWIIPLMNNMGIFKKGYGNSQRTPTILIYLILHPILELYVGHLALIFIYTVFFFSGNVSSSDGTILTKGINNCKRGSKITQKINCCGSHYYYKAYGLAAVLLFYIANNKITEFCAIFTILVVWVYTVYEDGTNAGNEMDSCFQLDWHSSWILQGFVFLGVLLILVNPLKKPTTVLQIIVFLVFVYYLGTIMAIYKSVDEDFNIDLVTIPSCIIGIVITGILIFTKINQSQPLIYK